MTIRVQVGWQIPVAGSGIPPVIVHATLYAKELFPKRLYPKKLFP